MPLYDYRCSACSHVAERLRSYADRDLPAPCPNCKQPTTRAVVLPHCMPDGMYSYAPNVGDEAAFARRLDTLKNRGPGVVMPKMDPGEHY